MYYRVFIKHNLALRSSLHSKIVVKDSCHGYLKYFNASKTLLSKNQWVSIIYALDYEYETNKKHKYKHEKCANRNPVKIGFYPDICIIFYTVFYSSYQLQPFTLLHSLSTAPCLNFQNLVNKVPFAAS